MTETDALSNVTTYEYDGSNRLYRIIYADDDPQNPTHPMVYAYNANSLISSVTDPEGNIVYYTYDSYGNTATETKSPDNGTTNYVTTYDRDAWGSLNWVSTPNNNKTYYTRDGRRYTTQVSRDFDGATTSDTVYTHTDAGRVLTITDPLSNTTTNIYGSDGRRTGVSHADNAQERWTYDANGNTLTYTDGNLRIQHTQCDLPIYQAVRVRRVGSPHQDIRACVRPDRQLHLCERRMPLRRGF